MRKTLCLLAKHEWPDEGRHLEIWCLQPTETSKPNDWTSTAAWTAWTALGQSWSQLFSLDNWSYVAAVDYWSNYIEFDELHSTTATAVVSRLKRYFATHGISIEVVSDNGPQFSSDEFKQFSKTWMFQHTTTSPYHHQSNGLAESAVKSVESLLQKS